MSPARRRKMVDRGHPSLSVVRQCALVGVSRSSLYYRPQGASEEELSLMREMDRQYLETPFYGSRRMKAWLELQGIAVSRKRVQRLMLVMGLRAIYRRPRTSQPAPGVRVYPYLLGKAEITRPNQVWASDITYLPMARGFVYLVAVMDWHSRYVLAWRLSNTLEAGFCAEALTEALDRGRPEHLRSDNGPEFTAGAVRLWLQVVGARTLFITPGSPWENGYVESSGGKLRDELLDRVVFDTLWKVQVLTEQWRHEYNRQRPHSALGYRPPAPEAILTSSPAPRPISVS